MIRRGRGDSTDKQTGGGGARVNRRTVYAFILIAALGALILLAIVLGTRPLARKTAPTPAPTATPALPTTPAPSPAATPAPLISARYELPLEGAAGFASVALPLRKSADPNSEKIASLPPGAAFRVLGEEGASLRVDTGEATGYLPSAYCLVNLPDIVPSIVYDATNTYSSLVRSSGKDLPGVTGEGLYFSKTENARLGTREFIMPVLYPMAEKIFQAQKLALEKGETLVIYEAYRPYDVQMAIVKALKKLADGDRTVMKGISSAPWALSWFASTRLSNHQRGGAIDVSLAKVTATAPMRAGDYGYTDVTAADRYAMPTRMHELSQSAAAFSAPVNASSPTAWKSARDAAGMNAPAKRLQAYMTSAGLTPLASEWWHYNDLDALRTTSANKSSGRYTLTACMSAVPMG